MRAMQVCQLGLALREERIDRGKKQFEVCHLCGISQPSWSRWECGHTVPDDWRYQQVADFLRCSRDEVWQLIHDPEGLSVLSDLRERRKKRISQ